MKEVSKCAPQQAFRDLDQAFENFFQRIKKGETPGYPKFKSRNRNPGHFRIEGYVPVKNGLIHLARIGCVRFMPGDRGYIPDGKYKSVSVSEDHGRWFVSVRKIKIVLHQIKFKTGCQGMYRCEKHCQIRQ